MAQGKFVSYLRVSTDKQRRSGLGLAAQRDAVTAYLNSYSSSLVAEVVEVESGGDNERTKLGEALRLCRLHNATLVIAKLDRLSRNAAFLFNLEADLKRMGLSFVAADMPDANELTIHIMAVVAQAERQMISARTKAALAAAKARGKKLGGDRGGLQYVSARGATASAAARTKRAFSRAKDVFPAISGLQASGASLRAMAAELNRLGITAPRGGSWSAIQVARMIEKTGVSTSVSTASALAS